MTLISKATAWFVPVPIFYIQNHIPKFFRLFKIIGIINVIKERLRTFK